MRPQGTWLMSLFMDIGTGAGLAGASGVRPFLPPLLAGALARGDVGIDFDGTDWSFLESPAFLGAVVPRGGRLRARPRPRGRPVDLFSWVARLVLGALMFAGVLADGGHRAGLGLVAGRCARPRRTGGGRTGRARPGGSTRARPGCSVYADLAALLLAAVAVFVPPLSFVALIGFVVLLFGSRRREGEKYAGLRILR